MWLFSWRHWLQQRRADARGRRRPARHRRPDLEALEARNLLSTFQWTGQGATANWTDVANWSGGPAGTFPDVPGDVAQFVGAFAGARTVTVDQAITVGEIDFGTAH